MTQVATAEDLQQLWEERSLFFGDDHNTMDEVVGGYFGTLPSEFDDYFHRDMHVHLINSIRLAWDDLAAMSGKVFPIQVPPDNSKAAAKQRAEKLEMIGYNYNEAGFRVGSVGMRLLMGVLAWWMIGCANAVALALPNFEKKTPFFTFRDPRTFFPPVGWSPFTQAAPKDALFAYTMTMSELKARYPHLESEITSKLMKYTSGAYYQGTSFDDTSPIWVGEYYHEDAWISATLTDRAVTLLRSDTGDRGHPDVNPVVPMGFYSPGGPKGRSMFADQLSIQAALARMFSQKLDFYDRTLYPLIFHTPISGNTVKMGPYATNQYITSTGVTPKVDTVAPAHPIDADQTMAFVLGLQRMLNRNPEQFQGAGEADSAKALAELKTGITATVRDQIWPPMVHAVARLYEKAAKIDVNVWPHERRYATGKRKNTNFKVTYTPASDLAGREGSFGVEPGLGLAGYQGTVEILQMLGAETISEDTALEQLEHVTDPQAEKRRIFNDRLQKVLFATLASRAQVGAVDPAAIAEIRNRTNEGDDPYDVLLELDAAGRLTPPAPAGLAPAGGPGGPQIAGAPGEGPAGPGGPSLDEIRQMAVARRR